MRVKQFRYASDNLGYLVFGERTALAVDGGAVEEMLSFLEEAGLELEAVTVTHSHSDHTCGNRGLIEASGAELLDPGRVLSGGGLDLEGERIEVIATPGHTMDSVCFLGEGFLLSGDTLLNGRVGRCFSGDIMALFRSVEELRSLPGDTLVLGGHDYVEEYMDFALMVDPGNENVEEYLENYRLHGVSATLEQERGVDPFLRLDSPAVLSFLEKRGLPRSDRFERFCSLLSVM